MVWLGLVKRFLASAALFALPVLAHAIEGFTTTVPITLSGKGSLHRVTLPEAVYRDANPDLSDVRIFNAGGEAMPIALARDPEAVREPPGSLPLTFFAVPALAAARVGSSAGSRHLHMADGTEVSIEGSTSRGAPARVAAYVLDATHARRAFQALRIDWDPTPGSAIVTVRVEGSDDLRTWNPMSSATPLVRLDQGSATLEQGRVLLNGTEARFLRITWDQAPLTLRAAYGEFRDEATAPLRPGKVVAGESGEKPGDIVYDLGARLPVEALRLVAAEDGSVIPAAILARRRNGQEMPVTSAVFYRLGQEGESVESPLREVPRNTAQYWIARIDRARASFGPKLPRLEARWRPGELVFVARGDGPFTLAFGNRDVPSALLPVGSLIPGYEAQSELRLPMAKAGDAARVRALGGLWPEAWGDIPPVQAALWAILAAVACALGIMAWRLRAQRE